MAHRYDAIGHGYATHRREDPRVRDQIHSALGDARSVVNVGAGTGSYEPADRSVIAVEPSLVMVSQRPPGAAPVIRATAAHLPLPSGCVDAAMAVLTVHHWDDGLDRGLAELRRVARGPVVIVTFDVEVSAQMWLVRDYLPGAVELDRATFPTLDHLAERLGGTVEVEVVPTSRDTPDWTFASFWAHPERVLDASVRASTSGFARADPQAVEQAMGQLERDLADGTWDRRNRGLRDLQELDVGMRLVVARP